MAGLCRIMIGATLLVHLAVGCCLHHAHACDAQKQSCPSQGCDTPDQQRPDSPVGHADHSHHGSQDCEGNRCVWISPSPTAVRSLVKCISPVQVLFVALLDVQPLNVGSESQQRFWATSRLLLPVRLHLAYQVLLI